MGDEWLKEFNWRKVVRLPLSDVKPNVRIIRDICTTEQVKVHDVMYLGDSFARDMLMAKQAGAFAVWAEYGTKVHPSMYEKLVRISHWTAEDVKREKMIREQAAAIKPDFVCKEGFGEVLPAIELFQQNQRISS